MVGTEDAPDFIEAAPVDTAKVNAVSVLATMLASCKKRKESLEDELKETNKLIEQLATKDLPDAIAAAGLMRDDGGATISTTVGTLYLQKETFVSVLAADKPAYLAWLRENGHGDLIKEDVNAQTNKAFVKELLEAKVPLPSIVKITEVPTARLRKS